MWSHICHNGDCFLHELRLYDSVGVFLMLLLHRTGCIGTHFLHVVIFYDLVGEFLMLFLHRIGYIGTHLLRVVMFCVSGGVFLMLMWSRIVHKINFDFSYFFCLLHLILLLGYLMRILQSYLLWFHFLYHFHFQLVSWFP